MQEQTPIYQRLYQLRHSEQLSLHTPGHKKGQRGADLLIGWLPDALPFDLTEIGGLDSIQQPDGPLLQAEQLTAELYGTRSCFFTTNGATAGLIGSLLATADPGSEVLLPRNAHLAALSAIILGDLLPRFVQPASYGGQLLGITFGGLAEALDRFPSVQTVLLVSPSYQGVVGELERLLSLATNAGCLTVVDEAHGAHLPFHPELPPSAVSLSADLVVHSAHKTLSALTGGAWVHRVSDRISDERVRSCLNLVQSTSPSWLILGSLDLARQELALSGRGKLGLVLQNAAILRRDLATLGWAAWTFSQGVGFCQDPLKINLLSGPNGYSGADLATRMERCGVYPEMAQPDRVLLMFGLGDVEDRYQSLVECLRALPKRDPLPPVDWLMPPLPELRLRPRTAYFASSQFVELSQAVGRVAARPLYIYPPGIPLVYPGELLSSDVVSVACQVLQSGGRLAGSRERQIPVVK